MPSETNRLGRLLSLPVLVVLFLGPVALLYFGIVPLHLRFWLGGAGCLLAFSIVAYDRWPPRKLGIRLDNLRSALLPYALFTAAGVLAIVLVAHLTGRTARPHWWQDPFVRSHLVPICLLQEAVFRGFLMPALREVCRSAIAVIVWNALLFAGMHLIYPDLTVSLPLIFAGGLGFAAIYYVYPNLILVSASHVVLNFAALLYCFFSFVSMCQE
jgi:membrane protease YdiL (CAAX protease family)